MPGIVSDAVETLLIGSHGAPVAPDGKIPAIIRSQRKMLSRVDNVKIIVFLRNLMGKNKEINPKKTKRVFHTQSYMSPGRQPTFLYEKA